MTIAEMRQYRWPQQIPYLRPIKIPPRPQWHPSDVALAAVVLFIAVYDALSPEGETISEGVDRYLLTRRWPTELVAGLIYAHVSNKVPPSADPIHLAFIGIRYLTRGIRNARS